MKNATNLPRKKNSLLSERERRLLALQTSSLSVSVSIPLSQSVGLPSAVKSARLERTRARLEGREEGGACAMNTSEGGKGI